MDKDFLVGLVAYILDNVRDQTESTPLFTKVVKLLYLVDVAHYRAFGRILTGLQWRFHHFGPWDEQLYAILESRLSGIAPVEVVTQKGTGTTWDVVDVPHPDDLFDRPSTQLVVDRVLSKWGIIETDLILDHVYEDTEPMHGARFGDLLDFAKVNRDLEPDRSPRLLGADPDVVERIKAHVRSRGQPARPAEYLSDPDYLQALPILQEDTAAAHTVEARVSVPLSVVRARPNRAD
jgi:hypothetical protein